MRRDAASADAHAVARRLRAMLLAIPGIGPATVTDGGGDRHARLLVATLTGRTSGLARRRMVHRLTVDLGPPGPTPDRLRGIAAHAAADLLRVQAARSASAAALGVAPDANLAPGELHVDRATATMLASMAIDPARAVADHRRNSSEDGVQGDVGGRPGGRARRYLVMDPAEGSHRPVLRTNIDIGRQGGRHAMLSHAALLIDVVIPETLLAAAAGRPLRQLVETGIAALDGRVIREAYYDECGNGLVVALAEDLITVAEARRMTPLAIGAPIEDLVEDASRPRAPRKSKEDMW